MPDGIRVTLRVADLVYPTGGSTLQPDLVLTNEAGAGEGGIRAAIEASRQPARANARRAAAPRRVAGTEGQSIPVDALPVRGVPAAGALPLLECHQLLLSLQAPARPALEHGAHGLHSALRDQHVQRSTTRRRSPRWSSACRIRTGPRAECRRSTIILGHLRPRCVWRPQEARSWWPRYLDSPGRRSRRRPRAWGRDSCD